MWGRRFFARPQESTNGSRLALPLQAGHIPCRCAVGLAAGRSCPREGPGSGWRAIWNLSRRARAHARAAAPWLPCLSRRLSPLLYSHGVVTSWRSGRPAASRFAAIGASAAFALTMACKSGRVRSAIGTSKRFVNAARSWASLRFRPQFQRCTPRTCPGPPPPTTRPSPHAGHDRRASLRWGRTRHAPRPAASPPPRAPPQAKEQDTHRWESALTAPHADGQRPRAGACRC